MVDLTLPIAESTTARGSSTGSTSGDTSSHAPRHKPAGRRCDPGPLDEHRRRLESVYGRGSLYDLQQQAFYSSFDDLEFWLDWLTPSCSSVLELACGTGRIGVELIERDLDYTGLDLIAGMLSEFSAKLGAKGQDATLVEGDMRSFELGRKFDCVLMPYNSFCHVLDFRDAKRTLQCIIRHLSPGGLFLFSVMNPLLSYLASDDSRAEKDGEDGEKAKDADRIKYVYPKNPLGIVRSLETRRYDAASQINRVTYHHQYRDGREEQSFMELRQYFPQEMDLLLDLCGFEIQQKFGDYQGQSFASESRHQVFVCRKRHGNAEVAGP